MVSVLSRLRRLAIGLQAQVRGWQARKQFTEMRREKAATLIQARVRGFVAKRAFEKDMRRLVICQNLVRKYFAKKELKKLKIEAKSVSKQRELNKGLENKIISLQQRLTEAKSENKELRNQATKGAELTEELVKMKKAEEESKARGGRIRELEEELRVVKAELQQEKEEKVDLVTEKVREEEEWAARDEARR